jgi:hypothetical protein
MKHYREALRTAIEAGAVPAAISALVGIAESLIERKEPSRAAEILALVLCYPMTRETRELAECLFSNLETSEYPRMISNAKLRAEEMTLDDLALEVIAEMTE